MESTTESNNKIDVYNINSIINITVDTNRKLNEDTIIIVSMSLIGYEF